MSNPQASHHRRRLTRQLGGVLAVGTAAMILAALSALAAVWLLADALDTASRGDGASTRSVLTASVALLALAVAAFAVGRLAFTGTGERVAARLLDAALGRVARSTAKVQETFGGPALAWLATQARQAGDAVAARGELLFAATAGFAALAVLLTVAPAVSLAGVGAWGLALVIGVVAARRAPGPAGASASEWAAPRPDVGDVSDPQILATLGASALRAAEAPGHRAVPEPALAVMVGVPAAFLLWLLVGRVASGALLPGAVLATVAGFWTLWRTSAAVAVAVGQTARARLAEEALDEVLLTPEILPDVPPAKVPVRLRGSVRLRGVTAGPEGGEPVLLGCSLGAAPGEVAGVLGSAGPASSMLTALVARTSDPLDGVVLLDDCPAPSLPIADVRAQVAVVPTSPALIGGTVLRNISAGAGEDVTAQRLRAAAEFVGFGELPGGLGSTVDAAAWPPDARFRLGLARAVARDAPVVVLHHPAATDEAMLLHLVDRLRGQRTVLLFTDRLPLLQGADLVYVLDGPTVGPARTYSDVARELLPAEPRA